MKRGGPIQRKTPLQNKTPLRGSGTTRRNVSYRARPRPKDTGPTPAQRAAVIDRDGGQCVWCGADTRQIHHRVPRGRGGDNRLSNLVLLCGSGTTGCHGRVEHNRALAYEHGLLVHTGVDPADQIVLTRRGWVWLDDDGGWRLDDAA